ncbi:MAG: nitrogen regulation protein NR(II) [Thiolinea sp.]
MKKTQIKPYNLLEVMACAVVALDSDFRVTYMNQAAEVLLGQSLQRMRGSRITDILHNDSFHEQLKFTQEQNEAHAIRAMSLQLNDPQPITLDCIITPQQDNHRKHQGWLLLELHRIDRQLRIVRDKQILQQQQLIHELVRGLAHEIKNPLGGLRGAAQLLESELSEPGLKEYTQIIISEADRLKMLVDSLLGPGQPPRDEWVNIHEVLEHVCSLVQVECGENIHIERDYDPSLPEFQGDRGHLVQICLNIMHNAVRALDGQGAIKLRTRIIRQFTIHKKRHKLVLKADICDNGAGVPEHLKDKIFLPMVSGHAEGSGLGLAIAQSLLSQRGGLIQYDSQPGETCFSLLIPLEHGERIHG